MTPFQRAAGAFGLLLGLVGVASAPAQITIPLADITRAYPALDPVVLTLNGTAKVARPTPLLITGATLALNGSWFCLDPLQTIYFTPTAEPAGNALTYAGTAPSGFNPWGAAAPGLTAGRIQKLADLFHAYAPSGLARRRRAPPPGRTLRLVLRPHDLFLLFALDRRPDAIRHSPTGTSVELDAGSGCGPSPRIRLRAPAAEPPPIATNAA
jgi:hypothetical protein